jgi:Fe-S oxidoreductase
MSELAYDYDVIVVGAGSGNYWNEEEGERINYTRARESFDTRTEKLVSACPFCLLMLTDGMKMYTEEQIVFDIAELVEKICNLNHDLKLEEAN